MQDPMSSSIVVTKVTLNIINVLGIEDIRGLSFQNVA
jgi:hypothetical protein